MNDASASQKTALQEQSSSPIHTLVPSQQPYMSEPFASRRVCFYKSGDAQFSGLPVVINSRTFKTFEALLDSLSKRIPLPFGVRTITTPRGHTAVRSLDQLHHGQSYICSDKRTVKPIDLEQARRKPPPWYHARPLSSTRLGERRNPGPRISRWNEHASILHTPKRLVVFRNGDPEVKHTLLLQKRTTHCFEALLDHIAEVMRFPVRRLHTPDGRRVEGLPALILCSGVLVAAGREPFRKRNYDVQKPFAPTWLPAKSVGRQHPMTRKKKSMSSSTKSRPFSRSSEHYIVNQLHNSFAGSAYDPTGSVERETSQLVESVAETETINYMDGNASEYICMPADDDVEKSFRVNEDGSMTVEMKVRLTIKEEETVHWTTTLIRQSVSSQMKSGLDSGFVFGPAITDNDAPGVDSDTLAIQGCPEQYSNVSTNGCIQAPCEEVMQCTADESIIIKKPLQPFLEQKQTENKDIAPQSLDPCREEAGNEKEHCLVKLCNKPPVPKPRNAGISRIQASMHKSAEILQLQDNGQERVLHLYEQQLCPKRFLSDSEFYAQRICACDTVFSASSNTLPSYDTDLNSKPRPATVHGSLQRQEISFPSLVLQTTCERNHPQELRYKKTKIHTPLTKSPTGKKRKKVGVLVKKSHAVHIISHESRCKDSKTDILNEIKKIRAVIFKQVGVLRGLTKPYTVKSVNTLLKGNRTNLYISNKNVFKSPNELPATAEIHQGKINDGLTLLHNPFLNVSVSKCALTRQTSMQDAKETPAQHTQELKESASLPALHYPSPAVDQYVQLGQQKSETEQPPDQKQVPPSRCSQELEALCDIPGVRLASKKRLAPSILHDIIPTDMHTEMKHLPKIYPKRIITPRRCARNNASLSHINTMNGDATLSQSNISERIPLPMTPALRNNSSPTKNLFNGTTAHNISQEDIQLSRNLCLNNIQTPRSTLDTNSLATCQNVSSKHEIGQCPQYDKRDTTTDEPLNDTVICANNHLKPSSLTGDSSQKSLCSQHSIEQIPKNNTLSKVSLFSNHDVEKTELSNSTPFYKKPKPAHMEMSKGSTPEKNMPVCSAEKSYTVKMAIRPDMRHVLDELCHSINSLREATQHKQRSCLEKSKSMPDLSSHLASTFGSSSRVLLAFLSVMTLKDGLEKRNSLSQAEDSLSCSEALLMLRSLKDMAAIEDAEQLMANLNALQKSASHQLLQSWKCFQQLSISSRVTSKCQHSEDEAIQGLMEELGLPNRVREELAALHTQELDSARSNEVGSSEEVNGQRESGLRDETIRFPDCVLDDISTYVKSVVEEAVCENASSGDCLPQSLLGTEREIKVIAHEPEINSWPTERIQPVNSMIDSNICENILVENQLRTEEKDMDISHEWKQEIYAKQEVHIKKIKERDVCEQSGLIQGRARSKDDSVEEDYILETDTTYSVNSNVDIEKVRDLRDACGEDNDRITEVYTILSKSSESKDLTTSEEDKSSFEDKPDDKHTNFFEDQVGDNEQSVQINPGSGLEQKWEGERVVSQACSPAQLYSKTDNMKENTGQPEMHTTMLAVSPERETGHQASSYSEKHLTGHQMSSYSEKVLEVPGGNSVHQENIDEKESTRNPLEGAGKAVQANTKNSTIAKLISNLETCTQRPCCKPEMSIDRCLGHTEVSEPENLNHVSLKAKLIDTTTEAYSSALAFSYDSQSSSLTQEPERSSQANRVKFIRDMFLAKSQARTQIGQRQLHSTNSDLSDSQPESTDSAGNSSQDTSSGDDDACRLAIAKGYVRRTIERLYGRSSVGTDAMRSPPATKAKQRADPGRTNVSSLASYHEACTRVIADLSYFSATNASDIFNAPADCVTLKEPVGSEDANLIHTEDWLLRKNQINASSTDVQESHRKGKKHKSISVESELHLGKEASLQGSLPSNKLEKTPGSSGSKFTYFNLPNASDSEPEEKKEGKMAAAAETSKTTSERNSFLPAFTPPVLKKADNKVHPLSEATTLAVVAQPDRGQSSQAGVIKQSADPDALEVLFVFCGQHCPIL